MTILYRVLNGGVMYDLPDAAECKLGFTYSDISAATIKYPSNGINADKLTEDAILIAYQNGTELRNGRWWLQGTNGTSTKTPHYRVVSGPNLFDVFRRTRVIPTGTDKTASTDFVAATPGKVLNDLFAAAQARGAMTGLTWDFTATVDSSGAAWGLSSNYELVAGNEYLEVIRDMVSKELVTLYFQGTVIRAYTGTTGMTFGVDRSTGAGTVEFVAGRDFTEAPFKRTTEARLKYALVLGDEGQFYEYENIAAPTGPFGREEGVVKQGGSTDTGWLSLAGQAAVDPTATPTEEWTRKLNLQVCPFQPHTHFNVGDMVRERLDGTSIARRIVEMVLDTAGGVITGASLVMGERILPTAVRTDRLVKAVTVTRQGVVTVPSPPPPPDTTVPSAVTGLIASSTTYEETGGISRGTVWLDWVAPTTNTDASALTDLAAYEVSWKYTSEAVTQWRVFQTSDTQAVITNLDPNVSVDYRVRAYDAAATRHYSSYVTGSVTVAQDTTPPPVPSTPTATISRGTAQVCWDGKNNAAGSMGNDFAFVQVHRSTVNNFTPSAATLIDRLFGAGCLVRDDQTYGTPYYYKLVSVDRSGNASVGSVQVTATTAPLVTGDLADQVITAGKMAANSVETDALVVGAVDAERIKLGAFNTNLVPDPSFEEDYAFEAYSSPTAPKNRWRHALSGAGAIERFPRPRSGSQCLRLKSTASGGSAWATSGAFPVTPGKTYVVQWSAAKEVNADLGRFYCRVAGGSTEALSEYPATGSANAVTDSTWAENIDLEWFGENIFPYLTTQDGGSGIFFGGVAYANGSVTGGTRSVSAAGQRLTASSIDNATTQRWGVRADISIPRNTKQRITVKYTGYAGTNVALRVYADGYDSATGPSPVYAMGVGNSYAPNTASGSFALDTVANTEVDTIRVYVWLEANPGTIATSCAVDLTSIQVETIDANGVTDPAVPNYGTVAGEFTVPAGVNFCAVRVILNTTAAAQSFFVDDISVLEKGYGGSEITAAGIRLFGPEGTEVGAFVSNRPNYFSVTSRDGETLATVDAGGGGSFQDLAVVGRDSDADGVPDSGFTVYGTEFMELLDQRGRGIVPEGYATRVDTPTAYATTTLTKYLELQFIAKKGRTYRIEVPSFYLGCSIAGSSMLSYLFVAYDGTAVTTTSTQVGSTRTHGATANAYRTGGLVWHLRTGDWVADREVRLLLAYVSEGSGNCRPVASSGYPIEIVATDVGPHVVDSGIDYSNVSPPATKQTYTKVYKTTGYRTWRSNGAISTGAGTDVKQGYDAYSEGDCRGLWIFPSMTSDLSGATVNKIEVYLYANHWYYNSGGTALIKVHGNSSLPSTMPSMTTALSSANWPKPGGRWVTLPSSLYAGFKSGTYRGVGVGPAGTTNLLYYGRFTGSAAQIRVTYTK